MSTTFYTRYPGSSGSGTVTSVTASAPLASSGGATPNISLTGIVAISHGGSGQATANAALNAFLPSQATNNGKFLTTDGTNTSWATVSGSGTVTSIDVSGGTTGLTTSGGPVTTSGVITLAGTLAIANGGTNSTTALNNNRIIQSSSGKIVEAAAITASRALVSDANGIPVAATTTTTELNFVSGVTSAIQTQLNAKQSTVLTSAHLLVGNGSNVATDVAVSGDLTLANTGAFTIANLAVTNAKIANATIDLTAKVTGVLPVANGGSGTATAFTAGSVVFAGASGVYSQDNAQFFWDDTNHFLGIGTNAPSGALNIISPVSGSLGAPNVLMQSTAGNFVGELNCNSGSAAVLAFADSGGTRWSWYQDTGKQIGLFDYTNSAFRFYFLTTGLLGINNTNPLATTHITAISSSTKGLIVQGAASQTANLQEWQNSSAAIKVAITPLGNTVLSDAALTTSATDGFVYMPTCAGTPTGTPTTHIGTVATVYDTTNNKLYIYNGAWKSVTLT